MRIDDELLEQARRLIDEAEATLTQRNRRIQGMPYLSPEQTAAILGMQAIHRLQLRKMFALADARQGGASEAYEA